MITVRMERENDDGALVHLRVTAKDIATAERLTGARVVFPIREEEFFKGSGPEGFHTVEEGTE